jgi:hypothetical protein
VWSDPIATAELFALQGYHLAASRLLDLVVLNGHDLAGTPGVVLPVLGTAAPPALVMGRDILIDGVAMSGDPSTLVVATDSADVFAISRHFLSLEAIHGFDPDLGLVRVSGQVTLAQCAPVPGQLDWERLTSRAARAIASELLGVCRGALEIATRHVRLRHQFGRPLGAFQVVRHRLADAYIAQTGAKALLDAAGEALDHVGQPLLIKALAGRAALLAVQAAQQVCGAMGFTAEFGLHRFVRRAYVIDSLFGGAEAAEADLGAHALASGSTPDRLVSL